MVQILKLYGFLCDFQLYGGGTDEEEYYFPILGVLMTDECKANELANRLKQRQMVEDQVRELVPELNEFSVQIWEFREKHLEPFSPNQEVYFSDEEIESQLARVRRSLSGDHWNLHQPYTEEQCSGIIRLKQKCYAIEGAELDSVFGETHVYLQTEKREKTKFYGLTRLAVIHPYEHL